MSELSGQVVVIGAGIIGLTTAITLAEQGMTVQIVTADRHRATTSAVAGATWGPWLVEPRNKVLAWAADTLDVLRHLAEQPATGVRLAIGYEFSTDLIPPPDWATLLPDWSTCRREQLPVGYRHGVSYTAPLIDMPTYLEYLEARFRSAGGRVALRRISTLKDSDAEVLVNCTGMGARALVPDPELYPVRGYHVVVHNPGLDRFIEADTGQLDTFVAIYPHGKHVVLGGTADVNCWDREQDDQIAAAILARCARIEPDLAGAEILEHRVGLRPTRAAVRVEASVTSNGTRLVHNYGHSGAGVSLAWGCATEVANMLSDGPA